MRGRGGGGLPACGFLVQATKGGSLPISVEKRAKGKHVTIIANVQGNAAALFTTLGKVLGVGGTVHERGPSQAEVEVQGEQVERVSKVLLQLACVRGLAVSRETAAHVLQRDSAHDALLQEGAAAEGRRKPRHAATAGAAEPPEDAPCRSWHGYWPYCAGNCSRQQKSGRRHSALLWGLWEDKDDAPKLPARGTPGVQPPARPATMDLNTGLQSLGMRAEAGAAVLDWIWKQDQHIAAAVQRREAPQQSLCAPASTGKDWELTCPDCGAVFGTKQTLKKHAAQHQRDRDGVGVTAAPEQVGDWRRTPLALESQEWGWEGRAGAAKNSETWDWSDDHEEEEEKDCRAPAAATISSFIQVAVGRGARGRKAPAKAAVSKQKAPCPICGVEFPIEEMDIHVDICLTRGSALEAAEGRGAASSRVNGAEGQGHAGEADATLPMELLETFLEMDLLPAVAARFWERYDELALEGGRAPREAFLAALEDALLVEEAPDVGAAAPAPSYAALREQALEESEEDEDDAPRAQSSIADAMGAAFAAIAAAARPPDSRSSAAATWSGGASSSSGYPQVRREAPPLQGGCRGAGGAAAGSLGCAGGRGRIASNQAPKTSGLEKLSYADVANVAASQARDFAAECQAALEPLLGSNAAEGVAAGVEVVLANSSDPDALANAEELLAAELSAHGAAGGALLADLRARLGRSSGGRCRPPAI